MTIISIKTQTQDGDDILKVELTDGSLLYIKECYLKRFKEIPLSVIKAGDDISSDEETAFRFANDCFKAEQKGARLIARAEQTMAGLKRKLEERGHDKACVSAVVALFTEKNLLNDERYAEQWLRFRLTRKSGKINGPRGLSAALGNRGIGREALKSAFDKTLDEDTEYGLLKRFLTKNRTGSVSGNYSLRGRLKYEGFSSPVINRYFDEDTDKNGKN